jgi:clan AA aspartic protease
VISGTVVGLQARMNVIFYSSRHTSVEIECVIDTGFEGFLTLPVNVVEDLELPYLAPMGANLADNSQIVTSVHQAIILWNEVQRVVPVLAMGRRPLLGTALLKDCHLGIDFCEAGTVLVDEIM